MSFGDRLTTEERATMDAGRWFSCLSASARHDLLRAGKVRRYRSGEAISERGSSTCEWYACASGAIRISSTRNTGRQIVHTYLQAGSWFGDPGLFDGGTCTMDAYAHIDTALFSVSRDRFQSLLASSPDLSAAVLQLQATRIRELCESLEEAYTLPLGPRLARQLIMLADRHGVPDRHKGGTRIDLILRQDEIANLVGFSRQRVNAELKRFERGGLIRMERGAMVVCKPEALLGAGWGPVARREPAGSYAQ